MPNHESIGGIEFRHEPEPKILVIGGFEYDVNKLPSDLQNLLRIYGDWEQQLMRAKEEVFKLEAALRGLQEEVQTRLKPLTAP